MTKRSLYALGFMIPGIFSPLPGVSATTPTVSPLPPPPSMSVYLSPEADDHNGVNDTVYQMLTEAGKTEGFRGGKAQRAWELRQSLEQRARQLDNTYLFSPLISRQGWLPPVIAEATSLPVTQANVDRRQVVSILFMKPVTDKDCTPTPAGENAK
ncbi:hypothetical protein GA449_20755 [Salmonella enterica]|nr:hypothetical protein [Salmonella enterica]